MNDSEPAVASAAQRKTPWAAITAAGLFALARLKSVLVLLKALPMGKFLVTSVSMTVMALVQGASYGWRYGVGFVLLLLVHELGHAASIRSHGIQASWPVFIPFLGAFIALKNRPLQASVDAEISFAGPVAGTAAALACVAGYFSSGQAIWLTLAHTGFFLNLFNLTPLRPLDGGAVADMLFRGAWLVGLAAMVGLFFVSHAPQLLLIGFAALRHLGQRAPIQDVTPREKWEWAAKYFGLVSVLAAGLFFSQRLLQGPA